ncbi:DUF3037 domain-containing protein [Pseudomonas stutzeri]|uniref:DUF3037 domain-containing protein n=1 Tax=Stutzerimonas stutzeri TaxID=316 RepID=UPI00210AE503|nr:DUF3037 domain-containing protein [Stutzerimonas stutzeri]MCQ4289457.1 DUF3037 domain-containing protein [Stutzerimonas stutzeri]
MITFEYSIIKYMPDPKRGEIVNVGLVVFNAGRADVRVLNASAKVRIIDGTTRIEDLESLKEGITSVAALADNPKQAIELLKSFHASSSFLSEPSCFVLDDINQYEKRVSALFNELVKPYSSKEKVIKSSRIHTYVKNIFQGMEILGKDVDDLSRHKVIYNYPLNENSGFSADFLLKNGKFHMTEAIDFNLNDPSAKFKETTMKVMTFMEGRKFLGDDSARYFVYFASAAKEKEVIPHINLAEEYSDKIFNLESKEEHTEYFGLMSSLVGRDLLRVH